MAQISPAQFRADFSEFANETYYPDGMVQFWLNVAYKLLNADRWNDLLDMGAELMTAHNLSLQRRAMDESQVGGGRPGGSPGLTTGPIQSASGDKISTTYATASALDPAAEHWNLTIYGTRLWSLIKMMGMGPVYIGADCLGGPFLSFVGAWPGPLWYAGSGLAS